MNSSKEKEEKRGFRASDFVLVVLAILGIMNTLMIDRAKIPDWYFYSSIGLIVVATAVFFASHFGSSWDNKINAWREENKRNKVTHKYFLGFRDLVDTSRRFNSSIRGIEDSLTAHYSDNIKSSLARYVLQSHVESETKNSFFEIEKRLEESNKNFRDLCLIMRHFEFCLDIYTRHLKIIEVFVREIMSQTEKPIAKGIEAEFEAFREKFNYFVKDFKDYCQKVNQELGQREFPEWAVNYIKKW